jgi:DNA-binding NarL/FixJ family response regulator
MKKIKIILVDDHKIFLDGLISLLNNVNNIEIVGTVTSGEQLIELINLISCDVIITDITMNGMSGIELTKLLSKNYPQLKVLILSMHSNEEFVLNAVKSGAAGYLPKDVSFEELVEAINKIANGDQYFYKDISENFFINYINRFKNEQKLLEDEELTQREIEVLKLLAIGLSNKEIADKLFISIKTVDTHRSHIMQKLHLKNSAEIVLFAIRNKLIELM